MYVHRIGNRQGTWPHKGVGGLMLNIVMEVHDV